MLEGEWDETAPIVTPRPIVAPVPPVSIGSSAPTLPIPSTPAGPQRPSRSAAMQQAVAAAARRGPAGAPTAASARGLLQYNRVEDRGGFFASDLGQQPLWVRALLVVAALALFAGVFWLAFRGTAYLKNRGATQTESVEER